MIELLHADCLDAFELFEDNSVDMVLADPPYGTTACKWDTVIPFEPMWAELHRIVKDNGAICLFGSEPFSSFLRCSNVFNFKYDWVWDKKHGANFAQANKRPLKNIENITVFYSKVANYYPQKTDNPKGEEKRSNYKASKQKECFKDQVALNNEYAAHGARYEPKKLLPKSILRFSRPHRPIHPTQKPVALLEYLIKTYTLENETVLDFTMGSGSTGVAAKNLNRNFIGIEKEKKYFDIAKERINGS